MIRGGNDGQAGYIRWLEFRNDSGEEIPAFAVLRITGVVTRDGRDVLTVDQPDADGANEQTAVNGPVKVAADGYGMLTIDFPAFGLYDTADGTPAVGETWGPENGSWKLHKDVDGFSVWGGVNADAGIVMVRNIGGGSCPDRNEIHQLTVLGSPTGGTFDYTFSVPDGMGGTTSDTVTFNWDDDATEAETALETHAGSASGDFTVTGGPFPNATIQIEYIQNFEATEIAVGTLNWGSLTGGSGVGVIASRPQSGYPS